MKQGFTIVELLASIAIMGLVIIISIPAFDGISNTIKEQTYKSKISMLTKSTAAYINKYHKDKVYDGGKKTICYTIGYLINKNVFSPDDKDNIGVTDPLNGGNLSGYLVATYDDKNNYELNVDYKESSYSECIEPNIYNEGD